MKPITATLINIYHICHRQLWLHGHGIQMEHRSLLVQEGKLIHQKSYPQRAKQYKELDLGHLKIDHYDPKQKIIHEIKKSNKKEVAYIAQLKYYLFYLEQMGISGVKGVLEYPSLRQRKIVKLEAVDREIIPIWESNIQTILNTPNCPAPIQKTICKSCSYAEFCYS